MNGEEFMKCSGSTGRLGKVSQANTRGQNSRRCREEGSEIEREKRDIDTKRPRDQKHRDKETKSNIQRDRDRAERQLRDRDIQPIDIKKQIYRNKKTQRQQKDRKTWIRRINHRQCRDKETEIQRGTKRHRQWRDRDTKRQTHKVAR